MGANFSATSFTPSDEQTLKSKFSRLQDDLIEQHGSDSYAGHLGIKRGLSIHNKVFKTSQEAEDYIANNSTKWEPAIAVKVGDFSKVFPSTATEKKEDKKLFDLNLKYTDWDQNLIKRVKSSKSSQRSCKKCNSKISVKYVKDLACPVCGDYHFISTETDKKAFSILVANLKEQETKVSKLKEKYKEKYKTTFWIVGGWCSE